jgi:TolA-binding protein
MVLPAGPAGPIARAAALLCRLGLAAGVAAAAPGCAGEGATDLALHRLEGELARIRAQNAVLSGRLDALEIRADGLRAPSIAAAAPIRAEPRRVEPGDDGRPELAVVRLVPPGAPKAKATPIDPTRAADRAALASAELARAEALLAAEKYDAALDAFAAFVVGFPEHPRAAEATMRRGECYLSKREPARAVEHLAAAIAAPLPPALAPEALALLARAHEATGDEVSAERVRARLRKDFPDHPVAKKLASREGSR